MSPPSFVRSLLEVTRIEFQELRKSPGLYLFGPLILLQAIGYGVTDVGYLDTPPLWTSGKLAVGMMNTLTLLLAFMLLFYMVESLERERSVRLAPIHHSTSTPSSAVLFGKAFANSLVGIVVVGLAFLGAVITQLIGGKTPIQLRPFFVTWGLLVVPTFIVWTSFVAAVHSISRNRYTCTQSALVLAGGCRPATR